MKKNLIFISLLVCAALNVYAAASFRKEIPVRQHGKEAGMLLDLSKISMGTLNDVEEKKQYLSTVQLEKQRIQNYTLRMVYENAYLLYKHGDYQRAQEMAQTILSIDPNFKQAQTLARQAQHMGTYGTISEAQVIEAKFQETIRLYDSGRLVEANDKLNEILTIQPGNSKAQAWKRKIDYDIAKEKVRKLKKTIESLGPVNLTAPEEYAEVSQKYEFLTGQLNDLNQAEATLHEIIKTMDKVMIKEFSETFNKINNSFSETFKELFKGGRANLKLTDPDNMLETGVEIIASPPGKKLTSISLLSGGEKTLTAISLLFAIIKTKASPFCILDEVEAALDEANVDTFGKYITKLKNRSQFIIITHKKKTMEYADILYGITMQESGVSKLVSVRLEDI